MGAEQRGSPLCPLARAERREKMQETKTSAACDSPGDKLGPSTCVGGGDGLLECPGAKGSAVSWVLDGFCCQQRMVPMSPSDGL